MNKIIFLLLFLSIIIIAFPSCGRRAHIQQGLDETEVEQGRSFYEGMSATDMLAMFEKKVVTSASTAEWHVINTPYYYIITDSNIPGGYAYSKITNEMVNMCTNSFCDHRECIFSGQIYEYVVYAERIYYLYATNPYGLDPTYKYCLFSTDLFFNDLRLDYEFPVSVESQYTIVDTEYGKESIIEFVASIQDLCFYNDTLYYVDSALNADDDIIQTIYRMNLATKESSVLLEDVTAVSLSLDGEVLIWKDDNANTVYYDITSDEYVENYIQPINTVTLSPEYKLASQVVCGEYSFVTVDHTTPMFKNDPYYSYYSDFSSFGLTARDLFKRVGADIYRIKNDGADDGVPEKFVTLTTDGIPDVIYWYFTDGKTMIVCYETYLDFENAYNININASGDDWTNSLTEVYHYKYAIVDLESKTIYKPEA